MSNIAAVLKDKGPMRSTELAGILKYKERLSDEAARQRISRAHTPVLKLKGIRLPQRESFLFLSEHLKDRTYHNKLIDVLIETETSAGKALRALISHGGAFPKSLFASSSGLPVNKVKGQLLFESVINQLIARDLIHETSDANYNDILCLHDSEGLSSMKTATLQVESIVLSLISTWLKNLGVVSYNKVSIRNESTPIFGPFQWDLVGPSYMGGLTKFAQGKIKNGFVVGDILLNREVSLSDIKPFLFKLDFVLHQKSYSRFTALYIAEVFSHDAFMELRKRGIILARPSTIFGEELANMLHDLIKTISNAAAAITANPEHVFKMLDRLGKLEGASSNLRGIVMEFILVHIYRGDGYNIDFRQKITTKDGEFAEIDVKAKKKSDIVFIECKGMAPGNNVGEDELKKWIDKTIPRIKKWYKNLDSMPDKRKFVFCSSGDYSASARELIKKTIQQHKKEPLEFLTGSDIIKKLSDMREGSLVTMFKEQFTKNPIIGEIRI